MNKNSLYRKGFVIGIMVLFVGASILPSISGDLSKERGIDILDVDRVSSISDGDKSRGTFYVGGSGAGNYSSIQSAIDAAISGDIVFVYNYSSPYYENIIIDKSINLIGEDRDTTIIDGGGIGDVVYVSADWVNITGFTIQNSGSSSLDGGIKSESNFNCFSYNNILYNDCGIFLYSSSNYNTITGNNASNNYLGIYLDSSSNNIITGNNASNNRYGICLGYSSNYNTITGNNASNNENGIGLGISSNYNTITGNNASNNNDCGILLYSSSNYNTITGNNLNSNENCGILLNVYSNYNTITGNNASNNYGFGIGLLDSSSNNTITSNNANSNENYGICLFDSSNYNTITGNNASNNDYGIYLYSSSSNNLLYHNNLIDNTQNAYDSGTNYWDNGYPSGGNYWDDYTGEDNNGDGIGDDPYPIPGGDNEDRYPLMEPWGGGNHPPYIPSNPDPYDGETDVDVDTNLSWTGGDPDHGDVVTYDVYFGTTSPPPQVAENQSETTYDPPNDMGYGTVYYWRIVAWDNHDAYTEGAIWEFTTELAETTLGIEITGGFGVHVVIRNVGDTDAIDVEWNVDITGGFLGRIDWSDEGYVSILPSDGEIVVDIPLIIGLGPIEITATAYASNAEAVSEAKNGFILLFFVILQ